MVDRVRPLKWEHPATGGTQTDTFDTEIDPNEDAPDCRATYYQNDTSNDTNVYVSRDSNDLVFKDSANTLKTLSDLVAGTGGLTADQHKALHQLIHFIGDGPADGFTSGAFREMTWSGINPTDVIWYTDSGKTQKIVERNLTWTGINLTTDAWKMYNDSGTLIVTVSDSITYSGILEDDRTRTITVH
jgi:hypothetical protein